MNSTAITAQHMKAALPDMSSAVSLDGLDDAVTIYRDGLGIPHVKASHESRCLLRAGLRHVAGQAVADGVRPAARLRALGRVRGAGGPGAGRHDAQVPAAQLGAPGLRGARRRGQGNGRRLRRGRQRLHRRHQFAARRVRRRRIVPGEVGAVGLPGGLQGAPLHDGGYSRPSCGARAWSTPWGPSTPRA